MAQGQAIDVDATSTTGNALSYFAEGNIYDAPNGVGVTDSTGFKYSPLIFGARTDGLLSTPSVVKDAAINTSSFVSLLKELDAFGTQRSNIYDVGAVEINGTTKSIVVTPLDSTMVGAGTPIGIVPVTLINFNGVFINGVTRLEWTVENEINLKEYQLEYSVDGEYFTTISVVATDHKSVYSTTSYNHSGKNNYYRLKLVNTDGSTTYSSIINVIEDNNEASISLMPNPTRDYIILNSSTSDSNAQFKIVDFSGKVFIQRQVNCGINKISINQLLSGMYNAVLFSKSGKSKSIRFFN